MDMKLFVTAAIAALRAAADELEVHVGGVVQDTPAKPPASGGKVKVAGERVPEKDADADDEGLDYETDVQPIIAKLGNTHGKPAARDVLAQFEDEDGNPCTKGPQVKAEDYPALIKKVTAAQKKLDKAKAAADDE